MNLAKKVYYGLDHMLFGGEALPVYRVSRKVQICICYWFDFYRNAERIHAALVGHEEPVLIFALGWHVETHERLDELKGQMQEVLQFLDGIEFHFLCNSETERSMISSAKLSAVFCNQNAFLDENLYNVKTAEKKYDAMYLARITPFKRHALAVRIPSLKLIGSYSPQEEAYFVETLETLSHATWTESVPSRKVPDDLAEANVGLCLSEIEGAMYVSAEYLLCGLPVVSTPSLGGRDAFFDTRWVCVVEPDPNAVAQAVRELAERAISPQTIRQGTIEKMHEHRVRFISLIQRIYNERGVDADFSLEWGEAFVNKLGLRTRVPFRRGNRLLR